MSAAPDLETALNKIQGTISQLQQLGLTRAHTQVLKDRFAFLWVQDSTESRNSATRWRRERARRNYTDIQNSSQELFLAVVLTIPPTECAKTTFDSVLEYFIRLHSYDFCRLTLGARDKTILESVAVEKGLTNNLSYQKLMRALFPIGALRQLHMKH